MPRLGILLALSLSVCLASDWTFAQDRPTETPSEPAAAKATAGSSTPTQSEAGNQGWTYNPDAGFVYQRNDFKWTTWGFAERILNPDSENAYRRVRQGMEFDLPRFSETLRPAFVYEVDLTDNYFFTQSSKWKIWENLFLALQDPNDPSLFRILVGENTHILSREDNLSSGNLPTISRSLILEEHGSVKSFGTQFGVQVLKALSSTSSIALSAQDNRGSLNQDEPRYNVGNSLAAKYTGVGITDADKGRKLGFGLGADYTRDIGDQTFSFATASGGQGLGGMPASGNKLTWELNVDYTFPAFGRPATLEAEGLYSTFSQSHSSVGGGYAQAQISLFDTERLGDLDPFIRYDFVNASQTSTYAFQEATRVGANYNLPYTGKLANFHLEYAHNGIRGSSAFVPETRGIDEFRVELRFSLTRYTRH